MKKLNTPRLLGLILLLCLPLTACADLVPGRDDFRGGETVTPGRLAEVSAALFTTAETEPVTLPDPDPSLAAWDSPVYWTASGSVVHTDRECYHLARASEVLEGSVTDALTAGKVKLCESCRETAIPDRQAGVSDDLVTTVETESVTLPDPDPSLAAWVGPVYWTASGSVVHTDRECYHLACASEVLEGSVTDALTEGKVKLCENCRKTIAPVE